MSSLLQHLPVLCRWYYLGLHTVARLEDAAVPCHTRAIRAHKHVHWLLTTQARHHKPIGHTVRLPLQGIEQILGDAAQRVARCRSRLLGDGEISNVVGIGVSRRWCAVSGWEHALGRTVIAGAFEPRPFQSLFLSDGWRSFMTGKQAVGQGAMGACGMLTHRVLCVVEREGLHCHGVMVLPRKSQQLYNGQQKVGLCDRRVSTTIIDPSIRFRTCHR